MNKRIYFLDVFNEDREMVLNRFPEAIVFNKKLEEEELIEKCKNAEILCIFARSKITANVINSLPDLKIIVTRSVGYDHIDLEAANKKNVIIANVPDYGSYFISEFVFALLLSGLRHIGEGDERVEKKEFSPVGLRGLALKGKTLGVIGTGKIGQNVTRIASMGFLMNVLSYDLSPNQELAEENHFSYVDLDTIWKESDIITLHCPLLPSTKHLINEKSFSAMKDGVIIVNTSRGGIIKTKALVSALRSGKVSYAFLDVLEHEDNIAKDKELIEIPNVITTPHIAFYADDSMQKMYDSAFSSIDAYIKGEEIENKVVGF